jgi:hypothetical protein
MCEALGSALPLGLLWLVKAWWIPKVLQASMNAIDVG